MKSNNTLNSLLDISLFSDDDSLTDFSDKYTTKEQKDRDHHITDLMFQYLQSYKNKSTLTNQLREEVFIFCKNIIIGLLIAGLLIIIIGIIKSNDTVSSIQAASGILVVLGTIFGILKIIVSYVFPNDDEKYITEIVKAIQQNDLKNKLANMDSDYCQKELSSIKLDTYED